MGQSAAGAVAGSVHGFAPTLTTFAGRDRAVAEVAGLLEKYRLVTVTGVHRYATPVRRGPDRSSLTRIVPDRRRALQLVLGMIWLLDAALQCQPYMFTNAFVGQVIQKSAAGNPAVIADPITWSAALMARHIVIDKAIFAIIQLLIAVGLLYRPTVKAALAASIPWAVGVWWIGEGLGGVLAGTASPLMGAPGAAIIYAFLTLLAWPSEPSRAGFASAAGSVAATGRLGQTLSRVLWAALWGSLAGFALLPANRAPNGLGTMLSGLESGEPGWIMAMDAFGVRVLSQHGTAASVIIAVLCVLAAIAASGRLTRTAVVLAVLLSAVFWVTEDFGATFTGQGTDLNSGLLLIVLAAAFWPSSRAPGGAACHGRALYRAQHAGQRALGQDRTGPGDTAAPIT